MHVCVTIGILLIALPIASSVLTGEQEGAALSWFNHARSNVIPTASKMNRLRYNRSLADLAQIHAMSCPNYSSTAYGNPATFNEMWMPIQATIDDVAKIWINEVPLNRLPSVFVSFI